MSLFLTFENAITWSELSSARMPHLSAHLRSGNSQVARWTSEDCAETDPSAALSHLYCSGHPTPESVSLCSGKCRVSKAPRASPRAQPHRAAPHLPPSITFHFSRVRTPFLLSLLPLETSLPSCSTGLEFLYIGLSPTALV